MYPNTFYRVSVKAYITDEQGRAFVVRENDSEGRSFWSLPGGGLDHGELPQDCLKREILEELGVSDVVIGEIVYTKSFYMSNKDAWLIWIVYRAELHSTSFEFADGVTDASFMDIDELESSSDMFEQGIVEIYHTLKAV